MVAHNKFGDSLPHPENSKRNRSWKEKRAQKRFDTEFSEIAKSLASDIDEEDLERALEDEMASRQRGTLGGPRDYELVEPDDTFVPPEPPKFSSLWSAKLGFIILALTLLVGLLILGVFEIVLPVWGRVLLLILLAASVLGAVLSPRSGGRPQ
ncbi:hypothetical protein [Boudabousia liubingyangii]|uniref:hypothetical protein n=1 Tax=Boudabousia liubingyangii TaxID=1921764 RepID=UPI000B0AA134|nr:hypothetical protein [Boudabousia liubingyangii]